MRQLRTITISDSKELNVDKKEILRYLRVAKSDSNVDVLVEECLNSALAIASPKAVVLESEFEILDEEQVKFDFATFKSRSLVSTLNGYEKAYVFCATIGIELDRMIERYSKILPSKGAVLHAVGSALIESFCDHVNGILVDGKNSTRRFSPGYGDLSLEYQRDIIKFLDAERKIGIILADSLLMTPSKSVTAIIGVK